MKKEQPGIPSLDNLNQLLTLEGKLQHIHHVLRDSIPEIGRIAVALYDADTDYLKTFIASQNDENRLVHYESKLKDSPGLYQLAQHGTPRIIGDLHKSLSTKKRHSREVLAMKYQSSYTHPMFREGIFCGFVFIDSFEKNSFSSVRSNAVAPFAHLITLFTLQELSVSQTLKAAIKTARQFMAQRDNETRSHLDRMSRYSRLIAIKLADRYGLSDILIESIFQFAPLHDIGKVGIPDQILLKPGRLTDSEFDQMRSHVDKGTEIVNDIITNFGLNSLPHMDIMRNIVLYHHEAIDGSGYPLGLVGNAIPIETRIITVADIFDALTSKRPYKNAWTLDQAFAHLDVMSQTKIDKECVTALKMALQQVEEIRRQFPENPLG